MFFAGRVRRGALVGAVLSLAGCAGPPPPPLPAPDDLLKLLSYAILQPDVTCAELRDDFGLAQLPLADTPDEIGLAYSEHTAALDSGVVLRLWYLPAWVDRGTVVVSCGNTGNMSCYLNTARLLVDAGWSVVMFDYEGFGGSTGRANLLNLRDDLNAAVDWALEQRGVQRVTLFGMSLGTIPAVATAVARPEVVNGLILDSPVAMGAQINRFDFVVRGRGDEVVAVLEPWLVIEEYIDRVKQPLLFFIHTEDFVTPPATVEELLRRAPEPKHIVVFEGLGHAEGQFVQKHEYAIRLKDFLGTIEGE